MSIGAVCESPLTDTVRRFVAVVSPETVMCDAYGVAMPLSGMVIAPVLQYVVPLTVVGLSIVTDADPLLDRNPLAPE